MGTSLKLHTPIILHQQYIGLISFQLKTLKMLFGYVWTHIGYCAPFAVLVLAVSFDELCSDASHPKVQNRVCSHALKRLQVEGIHLATALGSQLQSGQIGMPHCQKMWCEGCMQKAIYPHASNMMTRLQYDQNIIVGLPKIGFSNARAVHNCAHFHTLSATDSYDGTVARRKIQCRKH